MQIDLSVNEGSVTGEMLKVELVQQLRTILYLKDRLGDEGVRRVMEELGIDEDKLARWKATYRSLKVIDDTTGASIIGVSSGSDVYMVCGDEATSQLQNDIETQQKMVVEILDNSGVLAHHQLPVRAIKVKINWTTAGKALCGLPLYLYN